MYTLMRIMGDKNIPTIFVTYNKVLSALVRYEGFRYADLNLTSNKSELCEAVFTDSPYPHIILACEKESYHDHLKKLARIFRITFISLGGQGSYKVYEDLVVDLLNAGIDVRQEFHVLVVSDYDPQGYCIQDTVKAHLERAGLAHVTVHRVYLRPEHITDGIVEHHGIPYVWRKNTPSTTRAALTLYTQFGRRTGGIYKRQGAWCRFNRNGDGQYDVPAFTDATDGYELYRVELDNFRDEVLLELLIDALEPFIDGADYYYAKARELWRQAFRRRIPEAAKAVIQEAARRKYGVQRLRMRGLRDRLQEKFAELSADEDTLIEKVEEDSNFRVDQLQSEIDAIQEEIDRLEGQKAELEAAQEDVQETAADIRDFLHHVQRLKAGEVVKLEHQLETVEDMLTDYEAAQESALSEEVTSQFDPDRIPMQRIVDFSPQRNAVFERARGAGESFEASISFREQQRIEQAAEAEVIQQQEHIRVDLPDLDAEAVQTVEVTLQTVDEAIDQAQAREVEDGHLTSRMAQLRRYFRDGNDSYDLWEAWQIGEWEDE
jgi:hypothetical protein